MHAPSLIKLQRLDLEVRVHGMYVNFDNACHVGECYREYKTRRIIGNRIFLLSFQSLIAYLQQNIFRVWSHLKNQKKNV